MSTTETRTEVRTVVSTEEVDLYECPGCGQFVEDAELMPVLVNVEPEQIGNLRGAVLENHSKVLCRYCAEATWGFEPGETADTHEVLERVETAGWAVVRTLTPWVPILLALAVSAIVASIIMGDLASSMQAMGAGVETQPAFEQAGEDVAQPDGLDLPGLLLLFVFCTFLMTLLSRLRGI